MPRTDVVEEWPQREQVELTTAVAALALFYLTFHISSRLHAVVRDAVAKHSSDKGNNSRGGDQKNADDDAAVVVVAGMVFEWRRRAVALVAHLISTAFNVYLCWFDQTGRADLVTGYSRVAHVAFVFGAAMYIVDTALIVAHPRKGRRTRIVWVVHHVVAITFLLMMRHYRMGSFPAACFMISSATHIPSNLRWFEQTASGLKCTRRDKVIGWVNMVTFFVAAVLPIPYMFVAIAEQKRISIRSLLLDGEFEHIHRKCIAGSALIYVPHVLLFVRIAHREIGRIGKAPYVPSRRRGAKTD
eukprot:TRINITY_DN103517_c0_g1_i1.p2 TRINITY_DN103517_c0_g1~~TRINITY_DN103517_c0_g1_i1.p2  ORF type:complete len:300 (+),score=118.39 TRINITY_DN103517_c0_g1_i1:25-924(+)